MAAADLSPLERLLAEAIPTGTFGYARLTRRHETPRRTYTDVEQARHRAALVAEMSRRERRGPKPPHLRVVADEAVPEGSDGEAA